MMDENDDILRLLKERKKGSPFIFGSPAGVGKTKMFEGLAKKIAQGTRGDPGLPAPVVIVTTSEDYKKAMETDNTLRKRLDRIISFKPMGPEVLCKIAQKMLEASPLEAEEREALAECIAGQFCVDGKIPAQGARGLREMVDGIMASPLSGEAQAAVIKKLLAASPLETDQQTALAGIIARQIEEQVHKVGNGGRGLKKAVDKTLEGPLSADMEAVMIEKSPSYAAGVSRRNGETLAEGFTEGADVRPMKTIQFKRNPGVTL